MNATSALSALAEALRASPAWQAKRDLQLVTETAPSALPPGPANGDDCAAFPDGMGGYLLLAAEAMWPELVRAEPYFAAFCSVMVNVSDVAAMGGRPLGVVDALWAESPHRAGALWEGLCEGARRYGVPIAGGHTNVRSPYDALGVAILGRAQRLVTSFQARPGDEIVIAFDLRGHFHERHAFWNASEAPTARLRGDLDLLPELAEKGLLTAGKDISMAGVLGSLLMLLECSGVGATVDLAALPRPPGLDDELRWLRAFPSFGFVLTTRPGDGRRVQEAFGARSLAAAVVGTIAAVPRLEIERGAARVCLWDLATQPFMGFQPGGAS